jgi:predicted dehydrogenase
MINIGVLGYGYWGPNLVRNFVEVNGLNVAAVADRDPARLALVQKRYPTARTTTEISDVLEDPAIHAVAIATPVATHFELALAALRAGKHVWVEKPMTETAAQAEILVEEARKRNLVLIVDHTFIYTGAVMKMHEKIQAGELGDILYYDSIRVNLGLFQRDVNVVSDLAVHDFSILAYLLKEQPTAVSASGINHFAGPENIAYITLFYDSGTIAHINTSWLAPVKVRSILIGGSRKMISYNDLEPDEKVKVYDKGVEFTDDPQKIAQLRVGYRSGDMFAPKLAVTEALRLEAEHFRDCIEHGREPITSGEFGLRVVELVEGANRSIRNRGESVELISSVQEAVL